MFRLKMFFIAAIAVAMTVPASAGAEKREVTVTCPDGQVVVKTVDCNPGQMISVQANCAGKQFLAQVQCTAEPVAALKPASPLQAGLGLLGGATLFGRSDVGGAGSLDLTLWVRLKNRVGLLFAGQIGAGNGPGSREFVFPWKVGLGLSVGGKWGRVALLVSGIGARGRDNGSQYQGLTGSARVDVFLLRRGQGGLALTVEPFGGPAWRQGTLSSVFGGGLGLGWLF